MSYFDRQFEGATSLHAGTFNPAFHGAAHEFRERGFTRFNIFAFAIPAWHAFKIPQFLKEAASKLMPDPYDKTGTRKRSYARFVWSPGTRALYPVGRDFDDSGQPQTAYNQGGVFQPEFGDVERIFPALREAVANSLVLEAIIQADGELALASGVLKPALAFLVGVHIIKLEPSSTMAAVVTPDEVHRDGEPVTFAHLLSRSNCTGGENLVTTLNAVGKKADKVPSEEICDQFTMIGLGDSYGVDDSRVGHHVSGVTRNAPHSPGHRTVMLVDFSPLRAGLSTEN